MGIQPFIKKRPCTHLFLQLHVNKPLDWPFCQFWKDPHLCTAFYGLEPKNTLVKKKAFDLVHYFRLFIYRSPRAKTSLYSYFLLSKTMGDECDSFQKSCPVSKFPKKLVVCNSLLVWSVPWRERYILHILYEDWKGFYFFVFEKIVSSKQCNAVQSFFFFFLLFFSRAY